MKTVKQLTSQVSRLNETVTVYRLVKVDQKKYLYMKICCCTVVSWKSFNNIM